MITIFHRFRLWVCMISIFGLSKSTQEVSKYVKNLSERSKKMKEQKKNKGSILAAESTHNSQNAQLGLVMKILEKF